MHVFVRFRLLIWLGKRITLAHLHLQGSTIVGATHCSRLLCTHVGLFLVGHQRTMSEPSRRLDLGMYGCEGHIGNCMHYDDLSSSIGKWGIDPRLSEALQFIGCA